MPSKPSFWEQSPAEGLHLRSGSNATAEERTDLRQIGGYHRLLVSSVSALQICGVIRGNIAIPDVDPRTWRARGRKRKPQPEPACGRIVEARSPAEIARAKRIARIPWGVHR